MVKRLIDLKAGEKGKIVSIRGGYGFIERLNSLGIRENIEIEKVSDIFFSGPVVIKISNMEIALGRGMASKVFVETEN